MLRLLLFSACIPDFLKRAARCTTPGAMAFLLLTACKQPSDGLDADTDTAIAIVDGDTMTEPNLATDNTLAGSAVAGPAPTAADPCSNDYLLVPGVRAGFIFKGMSRAEVAQCAGADNMKDGEVPLGDGTTGLGTFLYPGTEREIGLVWYRDDYKDIEFVRITKANSPWHLQGGLTAGATLAAVEKANGRPFMVQQGTAGQVRMAVDFKGGALAKLLPVQEEPIKQGLVFASPSENSEFVGKADENTRVLSSDPTLRAKNPVVEAVAVLLFK